MRRSNARIPAVDSGTKMDSLMPQFRPNAARSNFISRIYPANIKRTIGNLWIFIVLAAILAAFCYLFVVKGSRNSLFQKKKFGIVIDGGSTGTRIHVFKFLINEKGVPLYDFGKEGLSSLRVNPGLSSFSADPHSSGDSLLELIEFAKGRIPKDYWGVTEIRLMATAGLRRLDVNVQERILESCRSVLSSSGFKFQNDWASVITGSDEGIYAWIAANYALGSLGSDPQQTIGIIELGGASAQVTFVSNEVLPPELSHTLTFGKFKYNLYSHSLLDFGQNVAYDALKEMLTSRDPVEFSWKGISLDPCTPRGYSHSMESSNLYPGALDRKNKYLRTLHAKGNFSECRSAALMLLQNGKEKCSHQHCNLGSIFIPPLQGKFLATENFFYTSKFFGLAPRAYLSDLMLAGERFCGEDWSKLKNKYNTLEEEDLQRYCFSSAYIVALLHDSLGIALDDNRINFANKVGDIPLDWALGAFILHNTDDSGVGQNDWIATIIVEDSSTLLSLIVVAAILIVTVWFVSKWRKPQLKTIYDLEKGRYIVTRVNR
ncbi:probable apyrase 6 isoform X2 [Telopea speciosissima]|uniref:probable apyrase 6 isoform X2 n=1 Tax=Telopea speciosissima TaxID=54955 RepID=UPI001CC8238A|nr:probable apyrase 6 isoform X2 [Telopea speciosissima]